MELIKIGTADIILQDFGDGNGKIIISDSNWDYNFSYWWGAMGKNTNLRRFIKEINSSYFIDKLAYGCKGSLDAKGTFRNIRKHIKDEMSYELPWYRHMEFQKDMREELNTWQIHCCDENQFVNDWDHFFEYTLNYYLIDDAFDRKEIEASFKGICEQWNFIQLETPREHIYLAKLFKKLQKVL
jgi:hypothetical protein